MFTIEHHIGRLIEVRIQSLRTVEDARACGDGVATLLGKRPADSQIIIIADYRQLTIFPTEVASEFGATLARFNARLLRSAIVVGKTNAIAHLQVSRLVRDSATDKRRTFNEPADALEWLGEVLTLTEKGRTQAFFGLAAQ